MPSRWQQLRVPLTALLALAAAIAVVYAVALIGMRGPSSAQHSVPVYDQQQKLNVLAALYGSSTPVTDKKSMLDTLSSGSSQTPNESEKLKVLQHLQSQ